MQKLVVHFDDDPFITGLSAGILRQHGITVIQRIRSDRIFDILQRFNPGVVLVELELPGVDGLDLVAAMKEFNPVMQVIVLTRHASTKLMLASLDRGATDYLTKPMEDNDRLVEAVDTCFHRLQLWQHRFGAMDRAEMESTQRGPAEPIPARVLLLDDAESDRENVPS